MCCVPLMFSLISPFIDYILERKVSWSVRQDGVLTSENHLCFVLYLQDCVREDIKIPNKG